MNSRVLIAFCIAGVIAGGCTKEADPVDPIETRYLGDWQPGASMEISRTLASNKISGCRNYQFKPSVIDQDEFLVRCARDGHESQSYIVWTRFDRVKGPLQPNG